MIDLITTWFTWFKDFFLAALYWLGDALWSTVRQIVEYIWDWTIGLAAMALDALMQAFGFEPELITVVVLPYIKSADFWLPVSEGIFLMKAVYAAHLYLFAYKFVKGWRIFS